MALMSFYRRAWMLTFVDRDPRIFDAQTLASLRQSTAFFGSTALISIGGLLAMMGSPDRLVEPHTCFNTVAGGNLVKTANQAGLCCLVFGLCVFEIRLVQSPVWLLRGFDGCCAQ